MERREFLAATGALLGAGVSEGAARERDNSSDCALSVMVRQIIGAAFYDAIRRCESYSDQFSRFSFEYSWISGWKIREPWSAAIGATVDIHWCALDVKSLLETTRDKNLQLLVADGKRRENHLLLLPCHEFRKHGVEIYRDIEALSSGSPTYFGWIHNARLEDVACAVATDLARI